MRSRILTPRSRSTQAWAEQKRKRAVHAASSTTAASADEQQKQEKDDEKWLKLDQKIGLAAGCLCIGDWQTAQQVLPGREVKDPSLLTVHLNVPFSGVCHYAAAVCGV